MELKFNTKSFLTIAALTFALLGFFSSSLEAQNVSSSSILVKMAPENPAPNEKVSITLSSYSENLDSVVITWSVNGRNITSGVGQKAFSIQAPAAGVTSTVVARIALPAGQTETRIIIRPNIMALLYEATDSYVPPFYKGKALPTADSEIKIVAMPEVRNASGVKINPKNMIYSWKKDYNNDQGASGYGKNSFTFSSDYLEEMSTVSVIASTQDQNYSSEGNINIRTTEPKISFYKNDAAMGTLWEKALASPYRIEGSEVVLAAPYFISPKDIRNPRLTLNWSINDQTVWINDIRKNIIPLQANSSISGSSRLKLEIENRDKIFQTTEKELVIEF